MNLKLIRFLFPLIAISFFSKPIMLLFLIFYLIYFFLKNFLFKNNIDLKALSFIVYLVFLSIIGDLIYHENLKFILNNMLFFIFISPIILLIIQKEYKTSYSPYVVKRGIEIFLVIQISFSLLSGSYYAVKRHFNFDINFGDIIAGTYRLPLTLAPDASNMIFAFSMVLLLYIYISFYKKESNYILIGLGSFVIFLASVNHLILALSISLFLTLFFKKPLKLLIIFTLICVLYKLIQPVNFDSILFRMSIIFKVFQEPELLEKVSLKGEYIWNFINDFRDNILAFFFTGLGAGTYSSRAAMFFTGIYVTFMPIENISFFTLNNSYYLWEKFLDTPVELRGSFYYPFGSLFSFIAELGLINTLVLFTLFYLKLKKVKFLTNLEILFIIIFLLLIGIVDNYWEYFQSMFIFYYILNHLGALSTNSYKRSK